MVDVKKEKEELVHWIESLEDQNVLAELRRFQNAYTEGGDWFDRLNAAEKASIEAGLQDFEQGNTHSHEQVRSRYAKYL